MLHNLNLNELVVLLIDDDAMVREALGGFLRSFGFSNIIVARNVQTALPIIQDTKQRLDLIISDWEMPGGDGLSLLQAIRKNPMRSNLPFVMVTSQTSMERVKISRAAKWKVDAYLIKPFRKAVFQEKIFSVLSRQSLEPKPHEKKVS